MTVGRELEERCQKDGGMTWRGGRWWNGDSLRGDGGEKVALVEGKCWWTGGVK